MKRGGIKSVVNRFNVQSGVEFAEILSLYLYIYIYFYLNSFAHLEFETYFAQSMKVLIILLVTLLFLLTYESRICGED